jgi:hypothetical protein
MSVPILYGKTQSEKRAEENQVCRQIVREINNFGITQRQMLFLIYLLGSELENVEHMRAITKLVRELGGDDLFLIGMPEPDKEITEGNDGTSNI